MRIITPVACPKRPVDLAALHALTANMTMQTVSAGDVIREMRDTDRY
jgi:hypothetical protein